MTYSKREDVILELYSKFLDKTKSLGSTKDILEDLEKEKKFDLKKITDDFDLNTYKEISDFYSNKKFYREALYFLEQGFYISENDTDKNYFIEKIGNIINSLKDINLSNIFISFIFKNIPISSYFTCQNNTACCKVYQVNISLVDVFNILDNRKDLNINDIVIENNVLSSEDNSYYYYLKKKKNKDDCIFLDNNKCSIHNFKPTTCSNWPFSINTNYKISINFSNFIPENTCEYKLGNSSNYNRILNSLKQYYYNYNLSLLLIEYSKLYKDIEEKEKYITLFDYIKLYNTFFKDLINNKNIFHIESVIVNSEDNSYNIINTVYTNDLEETKKYIEDKCLKECLLIYDNEFYSEDNEKIYFITVKAPYVSINIILLDENYTLFENSIKKYYLFLQYKYIQNINTLENFSEKTILEILISLRRLIKHKKITLEELNQYISNIQEILKKNNIFNFDIEKQLLKINFLLYKNENLDNLEDIINSKIENYPDNIFFKLKKAEIFYLKEKFEDFENLLIDLAYSINNDIDIESFLKHVSKYKDYNFSFELNNFLMFSCIDICDKLYEKKEINKYLFFSELFFNRFKFDKKEDSLLDNNLIELFIKEIIENLLLVDKLEKVKYYIDLYLDYLPDKKLDFYLFLGDIFSEYNKNDLSIEYYSKSLLLINDVNLFLSVNYSISEKLLEEKNIKQLELLKNIVEDFIKNKKIKLENNIILFNYIKLLYIYSKSKKEPLEFFSDNYRIKNFNKVSDFVFDYFYNNLIEQEYTILPEINSLIKKIENYYFYMAKSYIYKNKIENFFKLLNKLISFYILLEEKEIFEDIKKLNRILKETYLNMRIYVEIKDYNNALISCNKLLNLNNVNKLNKLFELYYLLLTIHSNNIDLNKYKNIQENEKYQDIIIFINFLENISSTIENKDLYLSKTFLSYLIDIFLNKIKDNIKIY